MNWVRRFRRKPLVLYILAVFLLYPLIQSLHLVRLITQEDPHRTWKNLIVNLRNYSNSNTKSLNHGGDYDNNSEQLLSDSLLSIKDLTGELLEELRQIHRELMEVIRSPLTSNKTEAHDLNTQTLLMIRKVNNSDKLLSSRARLHAMVEVKDIVVKEIKLIRKFTLESKPQTGGGVEQRIVPRPNPRWPQRKPIKNANKKPPSPKSAEKGVKHCLKLAYANPPMAVTALASYPGSGNTWLRHLIQEVTGLLTGSLHADPYLVRTGFPGEKTTSGKVVVVKSHSQPAALQGCTRAIVLLRNPYRSLLADFNRHNRISSNEHTGHAPEDLFTEPEWKRRANILGADWYMFYDGWLQYNKPLLVLSYEDLKINTKFHVKRIVQFLGLNIPEKNYECMLSNMEGRYHRTPKQLEVKLFNKKQVDLVTLYADMINEKLSKYNVTVDTTVPH